MNILAFLVTAVLVPMLVSEFTDWLPWLAARMIGAAAQTLPSAVRPRYTEEWLAELDTVPGKLSKLVLAIRILARAPATAAAISGLPSFKAMTVKALFDKMLAASALILIAPLLTVIALAIKITDRGPVFFRQIRIGKDGQPFAVWKFRTMVVGADTRKMQPWMLSGTLFRMRRDPRVTRPGAWLRRWSLDELPQLFNVLFGSMSLVGPRPALPIEVAKYQDQMLRRLAVRPGITGLWQVNGRSGLSWDQAEKLDLRYVENWSLALDLQILWKTLSAVYRDSDIY